MASVSSELMELLHTRATLQESFVASLGCPLNVTKDSAEKLRDAFEAVANRLLQLPTVADKEEYRKAAEKAAHETAFLTNLQSPENKQRREEAKLAFETAERARAEEQERWERNQARMEEEKRELGLEGGDRVFNAFADKDGASDGEEYGFGIELDEDGYGLEGLMDAGAKGGHGGILGEAAMTDADRARVFMQESERARQEATANGSLQKEGPTAAPVTFKVKAKDGKEGKVVSKMKARTARALEEGTVSITKIDVAKDMRGKAMGVGKKAKEMEKAAAKQAAKEQKQLVKAEKRMSSKVKKMQSKAMQSNATTTHEKADMTGISIENKGAVSAVAKLARQRSDETRQSMQVDRSQLQKAQARGPAEALQQVLAAAKEQESGTAYKKTVTEVKGLDSAAVIRASILEHEREEEALREDRQRRVAEEAAALGLDKGERVFNAFADLDGAEAGEQHNSLVIEDEDGYRMQALLSTGNTSHGGILGGGNVDFMEESRRAREEALAMATTLPRRESTVAPTVFKIKAKDGQASALIAKRAEESERAVAALQEGPLAAQKVKVSKSSKVLKQIKAEEKAAKKAEAAEAKKKLDRGGRGKKKKLSKVVTQSLQNVQSDTTYTGPAKVEIETKAGGVAQVQAIAKAKAKEAQRAGKVDKSKLQKVQARGPAAKLKELQAAAAAHREEVGGVHTKEVVAIEMSEEEKAEKQARLAVMQDQARKASEEHAKMVEKLGSGTKHHQRVTGPTVSVNGAALAKLNAKRAHVEAKYDDYFEKKIALAKQLRAQKEAEDAAKKEKEKGAAAKKLAGERAAASNAKAAAAAALQAEQEAQAAAASRKKEEHDAFMEKMRRGGGTEDADSGVVAEE